MNHLVRKTTALLLAGVLIVPAAMAARQPDNVLDNVSLYEIRTYAGSGELGEADGSRKSAEFRLPSGVAVDADGQVIVADTGNQLIRTVADGSVTTTAGILLGFDDLGFPLGAFADGSADKSAFDEPTGVAVDARGRIIVADAANHAIRAITPDGETRTIAGTGIIGQDDGRAGEATFFYPMAVAAAPSGVIYVADTLNHAIRKIENGRVTTLNAPSERVVEHFPGDVEPAGDYRDGALEEALFNEPSGLAVDAKGNLYVADTGNQRIRYIDFAAGTVTTVAGGGELEKNAPYVPGGYVDGKADEARFNAPRGLDVTPDGGLLIADSLNHVIRFLKDGVVTTVAGVPQETGKLDGVARHAGFSLPTDVAYVGGGSFVVADYSNNRVRIVRPYEAPAGLEGPAIEIVYGRTVLDTDAEPIAVSGTTFVPVRVISEALGYTVDYEGDGTTTVRQGEQWYRIRDGERTIATESGTVELPQAPFYRNDRLYLPIRFFAEQIDLDVQWLGNEKAVLLRDKVTELQY